MNQITIFYSWQSDRDSSVCRNFVRIALETALGELRDQHPNVELVLDSDTSGVAGTPPVTETILKKIKACGVFVGDVTFVGETAKGKQLPNPNVLTEYGYARAVLDDEQIVLLMNTAFGPPTDLPFDLAHLRFPLAWELQDDAAAVERRRIRAAFATKLALCLDASIRYVLAKPPAGGLALNGLAAARATLTELRNRTGRGDVPAIVPGPRLVVRLAPATPPQYLAPAAVKRTRQAFVPSEYELVQTEASLGQWASFDPPKSRGSGPNPEARWYTRIVAPGAVETAVVVGVRVDDDRTIIVDGFPLEGRLVETVRRSIEMLKSIGATGPITIEAVLHEIKDVQLSSPSRLSRPSRIPGIETTTLVLPTLADFTPESLRPMMDDIWLGFGFEDGSPSFEQGAWRGEAHPRAYEPATFRWP
ncbi:hypothetical protein [Sphingopyxis sp. EG6]|uniref:hypothetical protein n=1 Tax=Sphingopyxis sp. EG6 TaxID=1874061 RepID=UPI000DC62C50|nr:hypothetical protein [Sphingopyxis sp. EG6]BBB10391.1 hypothetical protein SPYCW_3407 [Sphingopyxis sp. EG6]